MTLGQTVLSGCKEMILYTFWVVTNVNILSSYSPPLTFFFLTDTFMDLWLVHSLESEAPTDSSHSFCSNKDFILCDMWESREGRICWIRKTGYHKDTSWGHMKSLWHNKQMSEAIRRQVDRRPIWLSIGDGARPPLTTEHLRRRPARRPPHFHPPEAVFLHLENLSDLLLLISI